MDIPRFTRNANIPSAGSGGISGGISSGIAGGMAGHNGPHGPHGPNGLPSIYIGDIPPRPVYREAGRQHHSFTSSPTSISASAPFSSSLSAPVSIPNSSDNYVPPPLPPPRIVPVSGPSSAAIEDWRPRELEPVEELPNYKTRMDKDEGYHSMESRGRDSFGLGGLSRGFGAMGSSSSSSASGGARFGLFHDHYQFKSSTDYDTSVLKKLDMRSSRGSSGSSGSSMGNMGSNNHMNSILPNSAPAMRSTERLPTLQPLSLPTRVKQGQQQPSAQSPQIGLGLGVSSSSSSQPMLLDSPSRYTDTPLHSAVSPRSTPFSYRSPQREPTFSSSDLERSPEAPSAWRSNTMSTTASVSATVSSNGDDEDSNFPLEEMSRLRDIHLLPGAAADGGGGAHSPGHLQHHSHHYRRPSGSGGSSSTSHYEYQTAGQKRRASSPPIAEEPLLLGVPSASSSGVPSAACSPSCNDHMRWRGSPAPRLSVQSTSTTASTASTTSISGHDSLTLSVSRTSSYGGSGSGSVAMNSSALSPATTTVSGGGLSPIDTTCNSTSPYSPGGSGSSVATPSPVQAHKGGLLAMALSPSSSAMAARPTLSHLQAPPRVPTPLYRAVSDQQGLMIVSPPRRGTGADPVDQARTSKSNSPTQAKATTSTTATATATAKPAVGGSGLLKRTDFFMCECCPKKPKKFDTEGQLRAHESEKQYGCSFCGNRFKNKNEAERHRNSLHVRRHSWSCAALSSYDRAFHESPFRPGEADTCGYCGQEFGRSGYGAGAAAAGSHGGHASGSGSSGSSGSSSSGRHATEQDWDDRIRHLQDVHKFRECNASKKFFRADHFRQHLKHSHAGTSGKWTNMLENACMMEEEPPLPMR